MKMKGKWLKYPAVVSLIFLIAFPALGVEEAGTVEEEPASVALGGGAFIRYLHLDLNRWRDAAGDKLPKEDLVLYGGRVVACGPIDEGTMRWRFGGFIGWAGKGDDDIDELQLELGAGGLTGGLAWRPSVVGVSCDLNIGGCWIITDYKRADLDRDWDLYERRESGLFYLEPLLSLDFQALENLIVRLQGGYTLLFGRGDQVGGVTGGIAVDLGQWM